MYGLKLNKIDMVIQITPNGDVKTLYRDRNPVRNMGIPKIHRASDVRFNDESQKWEIFENDKKIGNSHYFRENAVKEEIEILENRLWN